MKGKKALGSDALNQHHIWPSDTRWRTAAGSSNTAAAATTAAYITQSSSSNSSSSCTLYACIYNWLLDCSDDTSIIIVDIFTLVTKYMAPTKKMRLAHQKKEKSAVRDSNHLLSCCTSRAAINLLPHYVAYVKRDCYVSIRMNRRTLGFFDKKTTEPVAERPREHGRGRPRQSRERRVRRGMSSKHHTEW